MLEAVVDDPTEILLQGHHRSGGVPAPPIQLLPIQFFQQLERVLEAGLDLLQMIFEGPPRQPADRTAIPTVKVESLWDSRLSLRHPSRLTH